MKLQQAIKELIHVKGSQPEVMPANPEGQADCDHLRVLLPMGEIMWDFTRGMIPAADGEAVVDAWVYTTCGYCGTGCGMYIGVKDGKAVAIKGNPRYPVNRGRLCVKGLYQWRVLAHPGRAAVPMIRRDGRLVPATWDEALDLVAGKFKEAMAEGGPEAVGLYTSGQLTLEEHYALGKFGRAVLGTPNLDSSTRLCMASAASGYVRAFGSDGPPGCFEDLDLAKCIILFGSNPAEMHPQVWERIHQNMRKNGAKLVVVDPRVTYPARLAHQHLQLRPGTNAALLNGLLSVLITEDLVDHDFIARSTRGFSRLALAVMPYHPEKVAEITGVPAGDIRETARMFARAPSATTVFVQGVNQSGGATDAVNLILNMHLVTGKIGRPGSSPFSLVGQSTSMSNREVGGSSSFVGFRNPLNPRHRQEVAELWGVDQSVLPTRTTDIMGMLRQVESGRLRVLWNVATNPAVSLPHQGFAREMLQRVFLVVQDAYYPTETARFADVFLPAAQWGEKTGTYTNAERRVNLARQAVDPPGEAKADLEIVVELARRLGAGSLFPWSRPEEVFEEWKRLSRGRPCDMSGITYERLEKRGGLQWPCPHPDHPGTPRLYQGGVFPTGREESQAYGPFNNDQGRALLWPAQYTPPPENPDAEYPFWLNTGRILEHYHSRTKTKRVPELNSLAPDAYAEIHPADAAAMGIQQGDWVKVTSRRGWVRVRARVTPVVAQGQVFIPFHFGDLDPGEENLQQAVNHLTGTWVDPESAQPLFKVSACRLEKAD